MVADGSGVPAGWYPDPLGLPQLRWWDGGAWTEFTSAEEPAATDPDDEPTGNDDAPRVIDLDAELADDVDETVVVPAGASFRVLGEEPDAAAGESAPEAGVEPTPAPEAVAPPEEAVAEEPVASESGVADSPLDVATPATAPEPTDPSSAVAVVPEPFDPARDDPFVAAEATAVVFATRRARRAYERKLALESGLPERSASPYADLDTNPVDIRLSAAAGAAAAATVPSPPDPAVPQPADPAAPTAGTPLDGREDVLAQSTLSPRQPESSEPRFTLDAAGVATELPPERTLIPKRTYGGAAYLLAMLPPLALLAIVALRRVPELAPSAELAWAICGGAFVIGVLLAVLDAAALRRWGHERVASPLWALLTPVVYLSVRSVATRRESEHGRAVVLAWVLGLVLTAVIAYLFPDALELLVPGFSAPWASPLG